MNKKVKKIIKELYPYAIIVISVILIRMFIATPVVVSGDSMVPNLYNGDLLIVKKIGYNGENINRSDIIVLKVSSNNGEEEIIKRVIGLPGEHISYKNNKLYVNNKIVNEDYLFRDTNDFNLEEICTCSTIPKGKYLVLGDNRPISKDSTEFGLIDEEDIVGKAIFRIWPLTKIGNIYK